MVDVWVVGSRGAVARAAITRLGELGHRVRLADEAAGPQAPPPGEHAVVLDLGTPDDRRARWAGHLREVGAVVSASLDPADLAWARDQVATPTLSGTTIVPCAGMSAVLADLLAARAAEAAGAPAEVHTAHLVAERGGLLRAATPGLRRELAALVGATVPGRRNGTWVDEGVAEERRLAWFARPVGPHHAAAVPAPEVLTIPQHVPTAATVRGHLAMSTWRAEVLQGVANLARRDAVATRVRRRLAAPPRRAPTAGARWATVAEAAGERGVARAWANGHDLIATTGGVLATVVDRVARSSGAGVPAPSSLGDPVEMLDELAASTGLRWSVVHPEGAASA